MKDEHTQAAASPPPQKPPPPTSAVRTVKIHVEISEDVPRIVAFVMRSTSLVLATRVITLTSQGIGVTWQCEKSPCLAKDWLHFLASGAALAKQAEDMLMELRKKYYLPSERVDCFIPRAFDSVELRRFDLPPVWQDEEMLAAAR